ncbi:uncharacterized protein TM35_000123350 [Trypanosoma theileri]|uniref:Uncharacterized protein n=1 Tax=Trypanosoma theileri TaxID=67003 RepID=A0A1X0NZJ1_9TRYP|nr:uncharacterized protein TM35_000123350 [Trypanosoma theileri]ORC89560.1 hypothetical protein TM35_000123350 [Trypanosoma theileri]
MVASPQQRVFLPITYSNGHPEDYSRKYATSKRKITTTTRVFPIWYTSPGDNINKRGNFNSSEIPRSVHCGVGIRGQPHRKTYVDSNNMGTEGFNSAQLHRVHNKKQFKGIGRKYSTFYRKFTTGKKQRDSIYAHTDHHAGIAQNTYSNVFNGFTKKKEPQRRTR